MADRDNAPDPAPVDPSGGEDGLSRRGFAAASVAAAGVAGSADAAVGPKVVERDVQVKTPDGMCDAALFHPEGAARPAVVVFPDALGLRPAFRDLGRRLAGEGYAVLVPNPFYRTRRAPVIEGPFDFNSPADRAKLGELRAPLMPEAVTRDAAAFLAFLDAQRAVNPRAKAGVVGYCMGGPMTMRAAAANPGRVGAGASFHGGGLVTDKPDSPHLLAPKIQAAYYFGVAANDDAGQPEAKNELRAAFAATGRPAKIEVYPAQHGWCVKGSPVYDQAAAERAWTELLALYRRALV